MILQVLNVLSDFSIHEEIERIPATFNIPKHPHDEDRTVKRKFNIVIQNVVALASLNEKIDLDSVRR